MAMAMDNTRATATATAAAVAIAMAMAIIVRVCADNKEKKCSRRALLHVSLECSEDTSPNMLRYPLRPFGQFSD